MKQKKKNAINGIIILLCQKSAAVALLRRGWGVVVVQSRRRPQLDPVRLLLIPTVYDLHISLERAKAEQAISINQHVGGDRKITLEGIIATVHCAADRIPADSVIEGETCRDPQSLRDSFARARHVSDAHMIAIGELNASDKRRTLRV